MGGIQDCVLLLLLRNLSIPHLFPHFRAYFTSKIYQLSDKRRNCCDSTDDDVKFSFLWRSSPCSVEKRKISFFAAICFYSEQRRREWEQRGETHGRSMSNSGVSSWHARCVGWLADLEVWEGLRFCVRVRVCLCVCVGGVRSTGYVGRKGLLSASWTS